MLRTVKNACGKPFSYHANSESKADHDNLLEIHFGYDATEATVRLKWVDR